MPRTKTGRKKEARSISLPAEAWAMIEELVPKGLHGDNAGEVARTLILDQLKLLGRERLLPPEK